MDIESKNRLLAAIIISVVLFVAGTLFLMNYKSTNYSYCWSNNNQDRITTAVSILDRKYGKHFAIVQKSFIPSNMFAGRMNNKIFLTLEDTNRNRFNVIFPVQNPESVATNNNYVSIVLGNIIKKDLLTDIDLSRGTKINVLVNPNQYIAGTPQEIGLKNGRDVLNRYPDAQIKVEIVNNSPHSTLKEYDFVRPMFVQIYKNLIKMGGSGKYMAGEYLSKDNGYCYHAEIQHSYGNKYSFSVTAAGSILNRDTDSVEYYIDGSIFYRHRELIKIN